jgi:glycerol-3-phosphate acyltransferase PlsY
MLDALKGLTAVVLTREIFPTHKGLMFAAALFAVVGHVFPVWLRFRGGKGVATGLGSFAVLTPKTVLVMIAIFILIFLAFRYVSIASILSVALFPLLASILEPGMNWRTVGVTAAASLIIIVRHRENIRRLLNHTEARFQWRRT